MYRTSPFLRKTLTDPCGEHAEPAVIHTLTLGQLSSVPGFEGCKVVYRIYGCYACGMSFGYVSGVVDDNNRFQAWEQIERGAADGQE